MRLHLHYGDLTDGAVLRRGYHVVDMVNEYEQATGRLPNEHPTPQWLLSELQPIRGPAYAQICFENTSSMEAVKRKLEYDLYYIRHMGPVFDLRIILRTVAVVLSGKGSR